MKRHLLLIFVLVLFAGCSSTSTPSFNSATLNLPDTQQHPAMFEQTGLLPEFPPLIVSGPFRLINEVSSSTIPGKDASQYSGIAEWKPDGDERVGLLCDNKTRTSWAYYKTGGYTDARPVQVDFHIYEWKPDGDERVGMHYYIGVANYTKHAWEWHGPYDNDPETFKGTVESFVLNSTTLRDRYLSLNGVLSYVVVASNVGMKSPPADGKVGVNLGKSEQKKDTAANCTAPVNTQIDEASPETVPPTKHRAATAQNQVNIKWKHYFTAMPDDDATEYYIWRQHEDEEKPSKLAVVPAPTGGKPGDMYGVEYTDKDNLTENKAYKYYVQAHNTGGDTPLSFAHEVVIPAIPQWYTSPIRNTNNYGNEIAMHRVLKSENGSTAFMPCLVTRNAQTNDLVYFESKYKRPASEADWHEYTVAKGDTVPTGYGCSVIVPNATSSGPYISYFNQSNELHYSQGGFNNSTSNYDWTTINLDKSNPLTTRDTSIALFSFFQPVIAYHQIDGTQEKVSLAVASKSNPTLVSDFGFVDLIEGVGDQDVDLSLIIRLNGRPVLAFFNESQGKLFLLYWTKFTPATPNDIAMNQYEIFTFENPLLPAGQSPDLALGTDNLIHLSYINGTNSGVRYGRATTADITGEGDFAFTDLDPLVNIASNSLSISSVNVPFLGLVVNGTGTPKSARATDENPGAITDWHETETVLAGAVAGSNLATVAIGEDPAVSFVDNSSKKLMYGSYYAKPSKPSTPTLPLASTNWASGVKLSWESSPNANGYYIYRGFRDKPVATVGALDGTTYEDYEVPDTNPWVYYIQAFNEAGVSGMASCIGRKFDGVMPPNDVTATDGDFTDKIKVSWSVPVNGPAPDGYIVQRYNEGSKGYDTINTTTKFETYDTVSPPTLVQANLYKYRVVSTLTGKNDSSPSFEDSGFAAYNWSVYDVQPDIGAPNIASLKTSLPIVKFNGKPVFLFLQEKGENKFISIAYGNVEQPKDSSDWTLGQVYGYAGLSSPITGLALGIVGGKLAVAFAAEDLYYGYALKDNPDLPTGWLFHKALAYAGGSTIGNNCSLAEVAGNPLIAFQSHSKSSINQVAMEYIRSSVVSPTSDSQWSSTVLTKPVAVVLSEVTPSVAEFNGQPSIAYHYAANVSAANIDILSYYYKPEDLKSDAFDLTNNTSHSTYPNHKILNGFPAISSRTSAGLALSFTASAPEYSAWKSVQITSIGEDTGYYTCLDAEHEMPAISCMAIDSFDGDVLVKYVLCDSVKFQYDSWLAMTVYSSVSEVSQTGLLQGNSKPVIVWYDWTSAAAGKIKCAIAE